MSDAIHDALSCRGNQVDSAAARVALNRTSRCRLRFVASTTDSRAASAASSTSIMGSRIAISSIRFGVPGVEIQYVVASRAAVRESTELIENQDWAVRNAGRSRSAAQLKHEKRRQHEQHRP
ncbi:hypothetical protein [Bradyrhizobium japonicum]|uniref:hypothetical protein n=1 Tax=Bradyrhizobium japonicum TaxID=375 RepID=UPI00117FEEBF|nr:hypothetical protein [Bradyrhizobium japonicum]